MQRVKINTSKSYDVTIGSGLIKKAGEILRETGVTGKIAIVTDSNVAPLYLDALKNSLKESGYNAISFVFPAGEKSKNLETLSSILEFFANNGMTRKDTAVALGGGVTGDMTGFAAGVYMRGISYVQIPTTLLSCVDSSVGGKTAVDLKAGKNLAGVFIQPKAVIADTDTLKTLDKNVYADGMAEVIKTAVLGDSELFSRLENGNADDEYIISRCVQYKGKVVCEDEFETGVRKLLNLGHTPAHAIEKLLHYKTPHGHAVGIGLSIIARACAKEGLIELDTSRRILSLLDKYSLPLYSEFSPEDLARECTFDKKRSGNTISLIKIRNIGDCFIEDIALDSETQERVVIYERENFTIPSFRHSFCNSVKIRCTQTFYMCSTCR